MPCGDYPIDYGRRYVSNNSKQKKRLNKVTRLLCGLCKAIEAGSPEAIKSNPELAKWWEEHQEQDRIREAHEQAEEQKKQLKQTALSKLSPEEKKVLNIKE